MKARSLLCLAIPALLTICCCSQSPNPQTTESLTSLQGPALSGSQTYVLSGSAINARLVTINGFSLDSSAATAVADSAASIFASDYSSGTLISSAAAGATDYTIDFSSSGTPVSNIYYGGDIQIVSKQYLANPLYKALLGNIKLDIIRFPAGQERVKYDRAADATTTLSAEDAANGYQYLLTGTDVANYIKLCKNLDIQADPEFNLFTNDPAMWSSLADQIVNGLGYSLEYMAAGNEPDINPTGNWTYFQASSMTDALNTYMARYQTYATSIRKVKPDITFILGELANNSDPKLSQILTQILPQAKANPPGAFSVHWYLLGDWGQGTLAADYPSINHLVISGNAGVNIQNLSVLKSKLRNNLGSNTKLVIGEWATSWSATPGGDDVQDTLATAIYTAEVMEYGKVLGIDSMQYFGISDPSNFTDWYTSLIVENSGSFAVRPQYYVRMMYKYAWGNTMIPVPGGQTDDFSIYASKDGSNDYIMLINRTPGASFAKTIRMITADSPSGINAEVLLLPKSVTVIKLPIYPEKAAM